jgi:hypothetical protein
MQAVWYNSERKVALTLIERGADIDTADNDGTKAFESVKRDDFLKGVD